MSLLAAALAAGAARTLVVGVLSDPLTLDPHGATDIVSSEIIANVCEPLVRYRAGHDQPSPLLATTWATLDGRRWTFTLREGVRFQDGTPLDADAVVANLEDLRRQHRFEGQVSRAGRYVVGIELARPNASLLATLSQPFFGIQSPRQLGAERTVPVCTGPFRVAATAAGEVTLARNDAYWGGPPVLGRAVFRTLPGEAALAEALLQGTVDVTTALSHEAVDRLRNQPKVVLGTQPGLNLAFLSVNNERGPFRDPRVRLALARAIDREAIVRDVLSGQGEAAQGPLPPLLRGSHQHGVTLMPDLRAARRLLEEAGFPNGLDATLLATETPRPYNPHPMPLARRLQQDLGAVGVRVKLETVPGWAEYLRRATAGEYDLAVLGWEADTPDPNDFLVALLSAETLGSTNRSRYHSEPMEALLKLGRRSKDPSERHEVYRQVLEQFRRDMPWVPLFHVLLYSAHRREVTGLAVDAMGNPRLEGVSFER